MVAASLVEFSGAPHLRLRLLLATLSGRPIRVTGIRSDAGADETTGLNDHEASFLRLLEKLTNGCSIEISYTGTTLIYRPGVIVGGKVTHACPDSRAIGYFLEPIVALAPFAKHPITLTLTGITNDNVDMTVDAIRTVLCPQLARFGVEGREVELKITKRGGTPGGGGAVTFHCPVVPGLKPVLHVTPGRVKRIRGIAYAARVSPQMANRVVEAARSMLTRYIPDVYVYTDVYRGAESGLSPGYGCTLVAETTTDCLLSAECMFQPKPAPGAGSAEARALPAAAAALQNDYHFETPEDLGIRTARLLLQEIQRGACVDMTCQWLYVLYMAMGPEDVSKVRLAALTPYTVQLLRDIKAMLGVTFKITPDEETGTLLLTCLGSGYANLNKRVK